MKIYERISKVIACILAIVFMAFFWNIQDISKNAKSYPVPEEVYLNLEKDALKVAKTFDENQGKIEYSDKELIVIVASDIAEVKAKIPVSIELQGIEEDNMNLSATLNYNEITYERTSEIKPLWQWILLYLAITILLTFVLWCIFEVLGIIVLGIFCIFESIYKLIKKLFPKKND